MKNIARKSLAVEMDKCGGQNKKNNVLRLAPHLIGTGYFRFCEFYFYIRGHMKNAYDRTFNQLKLRFYTHDVFSYKHLLEVLGRQYSASNINVTDDLFLDNGKFLDKHYNSFKTGTIQKNHIFQCNNYDCTELNMKRRTHDGSDEVIQPMLKRGVKRSK
jgi:hypothetical protein